MPISTVMTHNFSQIPQAEIPRSSFDRSHGYKSTFDAGYLIPVYVDEVLPGDTFNLKMTAFSRLATPLHPFMDNVYLDSFFFAVPIRLIWDNWQKFNGEQTNPGDSTDFLVPQIPAPGPQGFTEASLFDYMGVPTEVDNISICAFYARAYNLIYNEWFRDENLQDSVPVPKGDGPDDDTDFIVLRRGKRHDYFTSCLPFPQKGPSVGLPLGDRAPVTGIGTNTVFDNGPGLNVRESGGGTVEYAETLLIRAAASVTYIEEDPTDPDVPHIYADLSEATASTINQLRQAFQIQKLYERDARGGTRYTEVIRSHFGVVSPDSRLQRPEYLGGGSSPINVTPIPQTSETQGGGTPQGNLAAMGTTTLLNHGFTKSFTEHCVVIGLVSARADLNYQQGLNRAFSRSTRWDYYWPALSHIGEQAVLNLEIFAQGLPADEDVFGYQERYAEYRYKPSVICGQFRSNFAQSLDTWHLAQDFGDLPVLGSDFIEDNPPIDRVIAVQDEPHFLFDSFFKLTCARPMPVYSVPGLIDHF